MGKEANAASKVEEKALSKEAQAPKKKIARMVAIKKAEEVEDQLSVILIY